MQVQGEVVIGTAAVAAVVIGAGIAGTRRASADVPRGIRALWEMSLDAADAAAGRLPSGVRDRATGTAITLFWFIAVANWIHLIPGSPLPAPTSDINLALALAAVAMATVHLTAIRARGIRGYLRHYFVPWWIAPFKLLEEAVKPLTLALRLFGMVFASGLMILLIGEILPAPAAVVPHVLWTVFDVFVGAIQAYIFALLTLLYFQTLLPEPAGRPAGAAAVA